MKMICLGDSITRGVSFTGGRLRIMKENYPSLLQQNFVQTGKEQIEIINKGVFNDNSDSLIKRVDKDVILEQPDFALLNIGGNDCDFNWGKVAEEPDSPHEPTVPIERYLKNVSQLIDTLKTADITPIVLTLPPLDPVRYYKNIASRFGTSISHWINTVGGIEHWHGSYNRSLNMLLDQMDSIKRIDVRSYIKKAGDLASLISDDGIHLTKKGYKVMSDAIFAELSLMMQKVESYQN
ncbi:SGNH/GDSL hydrolase family protein [Falsibacillus pallidus]|uniref:SGNH/GDSL hydrolase family protein n=1 Tax=Falsibacillus pallidus TaxID=493781 RepID=UPI003D958D76